MVLGTAVGGRAAACCRQIVCRRRALGSLLPAALTWAVGAAAPAALPAAAAPTAAAIGPPGRATALPAARRSPVVAAVEAARPAVVSVRVERLVAPSAMGLEWFFADLGPPAPTKEQSQGSGVIIDAGGLVLTNYHVVAAGGDVQLALFDGQRLAARVVASAPDHDLAVLRVAQEVAGALPALTMGQSSSLMAGETVIAIGSPFGLSHTVTVGVISGLHRSIMGEGRRLADFVQTDAAINPGNSGGPLLSIDGQLMGITTAIYDRAQGIGFAIPIDKARRIVDDLMRFGRVRRANYGFWPQQLTDPLAHSLRLATPAGALVSEVEADGVADGQLQPADVVVAVDGQPVQDVATLRALLVDGGVGQPVLLRILRAAAGQGPPQALDIRLTPCEVTGPDARGQLRRSSGLVLMQGPPEARGGRRLLVQAVLPGSAAARLGLRPGDGVLAVDAERVGSLQELDRSLTRAWWRGQVVLLVQRHRALQQISFDY